GHRDAELIGLDDRGDEVRELLLLDAIGDAAQGFLPRLPDALLACGALELFREGALQLLGHLHERRVEAEAGLHGDREEVERVWKRLEDLLAAAAGAGAEVEVRGHEADDETAHGTGEGLRGVARQKVDDGGHGDEADERGERLHAEEELGARLLHARALQLERERFHRVRGIEAGHQAREAADDRLQRAVGERSLQLELLEAPRADGDLLQAGLHGIEARAHLRAEDRGDDPDGGEEREDDLHRRLDLDVRDLADREEADGHHHGADADEDAADGLGEQWRHERRVDRVQRDRQADRQERHEVPRHATLRGQGVDLTLDADALADREGDRVEDLGEVPTDLLLDPDRGDHEVEVVALDP